MDFQEGDVGYIEQIHAALRGEHRGLVWLQSASIHEVGAAPSDRSPLEAIEKRCTSPTSQLSSAAWVSTLVMDVARDRGSAFLCKALLAVGWIALAAPRAAAQRGPTSAEAALWRMANGARAEHGLPPLRWDEALARAARAHAARVAGEPGELQHQYAGEPDLVIRASAQGARFGTIAENLARGGRVPEELGDIWMRTPVHRANILDGRMDAVGIGVVEVRGLLYAVEDFARSSPASQRDGIEQQVVAAVRQTGLPSVRVTEIARKSCELGGDAPTDARLVIQWDGSTPADLPDALLRQIAGGVYSAAAIGVCPSREPSQGFTTYRVAALLY